MNRKLNNLISKYLTLYDNIQSNRNKESKWIPYEESIKLQKLKDKLAAYGL